MAAGARRGTRSIRRRADGRVRRSRRGVRGRRQRGARAFHQVAELHRRRARGLAAAALHALVHRAQERGVDRRAAELDRAHRGDAAARRRDLAAR